MLVFQRYYRNGTPTPAQLWGEGIIVAALGSFFAGWLFPNEAGIVAVFLAAISSTDSIERLLSWNRRMIQEENVRTMLIQNNLEEWYASGTMPPVGYFKREKFTEHVFSYQRQSFSLAHFSTSR